MEIANPIYDVVFKYMMDDNKVAKLFLSAILGEEIETLEFKPQERSLLLNQHSITVFRLDFSAKIKIGPEDYKQVIVEIQKAKFPTDIMRFRKYLGEQYIKNDNTFIKKEKKIALPIVSIYFLGHNLENTEAPVIKVNRQYIDVIEGKEIKEREEFIESLTHDSYIIQIPQLKKKRRTELEILLSVFDQNNIDDDIHILNVKEEDFPEKYRIVIRRLLKARVEKEIRQTMDLEDEILEELENKERYIAKLIEENVKLIEAKDKALEAKDKALEEKDKALEDLKRQLDALKNK
ncbi:MAG: hypothetical protein HQK76_01825 [Desulfobacterales bacterium]|nr:hypothetical protein [Desulfobacterales bacterium]